MAGSFSGGGGDPACTTDCAGAGAGIGGEGSAGAGGDECPAGRQDCDSAPGCESEAATDSLNCGACGNVCQGQPHTTAACSEGDCTCEAGWGDCSDEPGCETSVLDSPTDCGACGNVCGSGECVQDTCSSRVFVTSLSYGSDLGGLAGADMKCQARADAAELTGRFAAWLSDSATSPATRFPHRASPYRRLDGVVVANDWSDLTDGTLDAPINVDEKGAIVAVEPWVWTGTMTTGQASGLVCNDWGPVSESLLGYIGNASKTIASWTQSAGQPCETPQFRLYCFEIEGEP